MTTFQDLLSQHIASSLLKQQALGDFLGNHNWGVDITAGTVDFGKGCVYPIQIIGTESDINGTWLWGWANDASGIPPQLLTCANTLRELGEEQQIDILSQAQLQLGEIDGHLLTIVASGVCNADAYYRGPYDGGAVFFLIKQSPLAEQAPTSPITLINMISSVISQFSVQHRLMVQAFLQQQGYQLTESLTEVIALSPSGHTITITFDDMGRISNMKTSTGVERT
ncbi:MAG: hypothetical protein GFH27_549285n13 [Chloroflexi bacterium AL-W]|nr:hypothetical protein [Chloroflexi bacterium AL-N1]NOK65525.1 hypothetical protein [Chloroflexi bacterium AL-N10]NOK74533.1 hypothetical protein [Chloroflexi bacterium AL-N5]NOK80558.1 hypothetical protein [Chloroflexi bacterium AL-W]NOK88791.1 hypothetical protein [Chloroflexi bacterium AL-N15]